MTHKLKLHLLFMDFSGLRMKDNSIPSDIDLFYKCPNGRLVFGEIKNEHGTFKPFQRKMYLDLADGYNGGAIVIYITHTSRIEEGADSVDIANCYVLEIYDNKEWYKPSKPITVKELILCEYSYKY